MNSGIQLPSPPQLTQQPQIMIGVDGQLSNIVSDRAILMIAKDIYLSSVDQDPEAMHAACEAALALYDTFNTVLGEWVAEKKVLQSI